jgi:hypothetical protein
MWNSENNHFWTGTMNDGITINTDVIPLDVQAWALLAFNKSEQTEAAINFVGKNHRISYENYDGFDFNTDRDMPWFEGTAQMVVAYWILGNLSQAQYFIEELREVQSTAPNGNGKGIVAAPADGLTTGFDWLYFNRLHVGATAWHIFAEKQYNPYWPPEDNTVLPKGDLNGNRLSADAGDLVLMKRASIGEIQADSRYDLNNNRQFADAGDLVLMKRASIGEITLS